MRVNIYSQELTEEMVVGGHVSENGASYGYVRFVLHSSERLHHTLDDDDRSGVTFRLPRSPERREALARVFRAAAERIEQMPKDFDDDD